MQIDKEKKKWGNSVRRKKVTVVSGKRSGRKKTDCSIRKEEVKTLPRRLRQHLPENICKTGHMLSDAVLNKSKRTEKNEGI